MSERISEVTERTLICIFNDYLCHLLGVSCSIMLTREAIENEFVANKCIVNLTKFLICIYCADSGVLNI